MSDASTDTSITPAPARDRPLAVHALMFGGAAGAITSAGRWAGFAFGFHGGVLDTVLLFVPLVALILGVQHWRDDRLGGAIRFSQAFGAALAIGLVFATIEGLFGWLHAAVLEPGIVEIMVQFMRETLAKQGESAAAVDAAEATFRRNFSPAAYGQLMFVTGLVVSFVESLLASLFVRRNVTA